MLRFRFLGTPQVEQDGKPVERFRSRKALALLGYLAVQRHPVPRSHLASLLWEAMDESRGRANLSWVLHRISGLIPNCVATNRHTVQIRRAPNCWLDIDVLDAIHQGTKLKALEAAVQQYRGAFLEGIHLDGCSAFEIWLAGERERWRRRAADGLETLVARHSQQGAYEEALRAARRLLALEPWREGTHRNVMRLLARRGQYRLATAQYESCRQLLADELGIEPTQKTVVLYERIRRVQAGGRHNLPPQPTPCIGRRRETADVIHLLDSPDCRLLTLLGPGGIGKTRLALEAASARRDAFLDGVWFVPLASVTSDEFLDSTIANALQASFSGRAGARADLIHHLRRRETLLILDSCEHLRGTSDLVVHILQEAPEVKLLVTSQASLSLRWEWRYEVEGLSYPMGDGPGEYDPGTYSAMALFEQVARRFNPRFSLASCNAQAVARVCELVQGMPLAIELAATWTKTHACDTIAREIEKDLRFLTSSLEDVPARHSGIRATFEHSWHLLAPREQAAFLKLSVFRGRFDTRAAFEVTETSLGVLDRLVDRSMLRLALSKRYEMHRLLKRCASEKLKLAPQLYSDTRNKHAAYYLARLRDLACNASQATTTKALAGILPEMADLRAAWRWVARQGQLKMMGKSASALSPFYLLTGPCQ